MNHFFMSLTGITMLGVAGVANMPAPENVDAVMGVDEPVVSVNAENANTWMLTRGNTNEICLVSKVRVLTSSTYEADVDPACYEMYPEADRITVWQQDDFGNVTLADDKGVKVIEFMISEEMALQSIYPKNVNLSLTPNG